jgi:hypothetical protein
MIFGHTRALDGPLTRPRAPRTPSRPTSDALIGRPRQRTSETAALCFQSVAHCPSLLTSFSALCFDTLTHSFSRNSPEMIFMQHCPYIFSPIISQTRRLPAPASAASRVRASCTSPRRNSVPHAVPTALSGFTPCLAGGYTDPLCAGPGFGCGLHAQAHAETSPSPGRAGSGLHAQARAEKR